MTPPPTKNVRLNFMVQINQSIDMKGRMLFPLGFYPRLLDLHCHPSFLGISCCQGASAAAAPLPPIEPTSNSWERQTTHPKKRPASMSTFYTCYFKSSNHFPKQRGILLHIELNPLRCNESSRLVQQSKLMNSLAVRSYPS